MKVATALRGDGARVLIDIPIAVPYPAFAEKVISTPDIAARVDQAKTEGRLPQAYYTHPAVERAEDAELVVPFVVYTDAVSFSRTDSGLGFWMMCCLITGVHHMCAIIRQTEVCNCGCRSWCAIRPILRMLASSIATMMEGVHPRDRHDGPLKVTTTCGQTWGDTARPPRRNAVLRTGHDGTSCGYGPSRPRYPRPPVSEMQMHSG